MHEVLAHHLRGMKDGATPSEEECLEVLEGVLFGIELEGARLVGPDGKPVPWRLRLVRRRGRPDWGRDDPPPAAVAAPVAETRMTGTLDWIAESEAPGIGRASGTVTIAPGGKGLDLGEVRLPPRSGPALRVEVPTWAPTDGLTASVTMGRTSYLWSGALGKDGEVIDDLSWVGPGEQILVTLDAPGLVPRLLRIDGPPPWVARWPDTSLRIRVVGEGGDAVEDASVVLDDPATSCPVEDGEALLRGMPPGEHEVVVAAQGHRARVLKLSLKDGDPRDITVHLAPR